MDVPSKSYETFSIAKVCELTYNSDTKCIVATYGTWYFDTIPQSGSWIGTQHLETYLNATMENYNLAIENLLNKGYTKL
jgi:hypothetical protein